MIEEVFENQRLQVSGWGWGTPFSQAARHACMLPVHAFRSCLLAGACSGTSTGSQHLPFSALTSRCLGCLALQPFRGWGHSWPGHFLPTDKVGVCVFVWALKCVLACLRLHGRSRGSRRSVAGSVSHEYMAEIQLPAMCPSYTQLSHCCMLMQSPPNPRRSTTGRGGSTKASLSWPAASSTPLHHRFQRCLDPPAGASDMKMSGTRERHHSGQPTCLSTANSCWEAPSYPSASVSLSGLPCCHTLLLTLFPRRPAA